MQLLQRGSFLFIAITLAGVLSTDARSLASSTTDRSIDPARAVGGNINKETTEQDLINTYGKKNVQRAKIAVGEGEKVDGTVLFPGTKDALTIEWKADFARPERITITNVGTRWRTKEGISIGTTLKTVEQANKGPFKLTGFEWDYPGRTTSWEKGKLSPSLQLDFAATKKVSAKEQAMVAGSDSFSSRHPVMGKMMLKVVRISVRW
jgi:hypothetical protein